uniref:Uncharacterized protein n=1 Tax=Panagrolaimus sp. JU765 TaxID=591449 RepID=A0AC34Q7X0_9BILA
MLKDLDFYQNKMKNYKGSFFDFSSERAGYLMPYMTSWQNSVSFYFENFYPGKDGIVFIRIKELDVKNCMFQHNVIDFQAFYSHMSRFFHEIPLPFTMVNNGTGLCKTTILNIPSNQTQGFHSFWTTSVVNVVILDAKKNIILEFNKHNASVVPSLKLDDIFYEILLPSHSSVTFKAYRK